MPAFRWRDCLPDQCRRFPQASKLEADGAEAGGDDFAREQARAAVEEVGAPGRPPHAPVPQDDDDGGGDGIHWGDDDDDDDKEVGAPSTLRFQQDAARGDTQLAALLPAPLPALLVRAFRQLSWLRKLRCICSCVCSGSCSYWASGIVAVGQADGRAGAGTAFTLRVLLS